MIVFGGDRHRMPFSDTFVYDLKAQFETLQVQWLHSSNLKIMNNDDISEILLQEVSSHFIGPKTVKKYDKAY